mmetsp:Transcript_103487/g.163436  ORF Transcript_103487/g.163436 Transcript_103487/m.163436 type:complete len:124 (+) Transcript_103487:60-431(+)|eukprot:CAMPEP_0169130396 /NCGR_PEP_ID=MMETSP1015-20121227/37674_1 /TAXON_ID=342587 /ORGANISM="Karlodinium micrum, Strain CCMP2283" /LENGTH=123 /DNA_ID=CAMNT_0009194553 /DNA_START=59 /DNA_END=430 /DNA_ORIENTATION=+
MSSSFQIDAPDSVSAKGERRVSRVSFGEIQEVEHEDHPDDFVSTSSALLVQQIDFSSEAADEIDDDDSDNLSDLLASADRRKLRRSVTANVGRSDSVLPAVATSKLWQRRLSFSEESFRNNSS